MTRAAQGVIFTSLEVAQEVYNQTQTKTGLQVIVDTLEKVYETGRKAIESFKEDMQIVFDNLLPQWNYTVVPKMQNVSII